MADALFLTPKERDLLQRIINQVQSGRHNPSRRPSGTSSQWTDREDHQAPEVYIAKPQTGVVIKPIRLKPTSTSGEAITIDYGLCDVYALGANVNADVIISDNVTVDLDRYQLDPIELDAVVYNLSRRSVVNEMVVVYRDKYGKWVFNAPTPNIGEILVKSAYAFGLERFAPVGYDGTTVNPLLSIENHRNYEDSPVYYCTKPEPRHINRFATLLQPLEPGETGWAVISGRAISKIAYATSPSITPNDRSPRHVGRPVWSSLWANLELPVTYTDPMTFWRRLVYSTFQGSGLGSQAIASQRTTYGVEGLAEDNVMWPSASLLNAQVGRINIYTSPNSQSVMCSGRSSAICENGNWKILRDECGSGCHSNNVLETAAGWYDRSGIFYGLAFPCTEGTIVQALPCESEIAEYIAEIVHGEPRPAPIYTDAWGDSSHQCQYVEHCRYDCVQIDNDWTWVTTYDCQKESSTAPNGCHCIDLDTDVY